MQENKVMLEAGQVYEALGLPPSHQFKSPGTSPKVGPFMHRPLGGAPPGRPKVLLPACLPASLR